MFLDFWNFLIFVWFCIFLFLSNFLPLNLCIFSPWICAWRRMNKFKWTKIVFTRTRSDYRSKSSWEIYQNEGFNSQHIWRYESHCDLLFSCLFSRKETLSKNLNKIQSRCLLSSARNRHYHQTEVGWYSSMTVPAQARG